MAFDPKAIAICVTTSYPKWYRGNLRSIKHTDKVRGDLALDFLSRAIKRGYQVVLADSKSSKTFRRELSKFPEVRVIKRRSTKRSPGKRLTIKMASELAGVKVLVLTEAEKTSLLDSIFLIIHPVLEGLADIVVPKRNQELFKSTYPSYMYESEVEGNKIYNETLRAYGLLSKHMEDLDMFFGPRVFRNDKKIISLFMKRFDYKLMGAVLAHRIFDPEEYSNVQYFPIVKALKRDFKVKSVETPFSYPLIQKENEEVGARIAFLEKRKIQRLSVLLDLIHFMSHLKNKKT